LNVPRYPPVRTDGPFHVPPVCACAPKKLKRFTAAPLEHKLTDASAPAFGGAIIEMVSAVVVAHCPAVGVNVYVVVVELLIEGDQLPVMPLVEVVGNAGTLAPLQYGPTAANVGVTLGVIVIVSCVVVAH